MSKKQRASSLLPAPAVSLERAVRLHRLVRLVGTTPQSRAAILKKLRIDVRTFYRDMELLRQWGIEVPQSNRKYCLALILEKAVAALPFPDPNLTLGEAIVLAKGRTAVHQKLRRLIAEITASPRRSDNL